MNLYRYVGPKRIADRIRPEQIGVPIRSADDVREWARSTSQDVSSGCVIATFVVDAAGVFLIADRRSEHVACAGGKPVKSAGEITFAFGQSVDVVAVSNQSTGYCPEPESWPSVAMALVAAQLEPPVGFSLACKFRRCVGCGNLTLIKEEIFECGVCGADLPATYNCQTPNAKR